MTSGEAARTWTRAQVAARIDHTLLRPEATPADVAQLCADATRLGVGAVCVSPSMLPIPVEWLGRGIVVATVIGFPSGAHTPHIKATEAAAAVFAGAGEVDMVIDLGRAKAGDWAGVRHDVQQVAEAVGPGIVLKVIVESAVLTTDELVAACHAAEDGGAQYVKTSTGFHPAGGATIDAVKLMADTVGRRLGVKASGGIRSAEQALAMLDAGATRLGTSSSAAILDGLPTS